MQGELRCARCGSGELAERADGFRCWRCGAKVVPPDAEDRAVGARAAALAAPAAAPAPAPAPAAPAAPDAAPPPAPASAPPRPAAPPPAAALPPGAPFGPLAAPIVPGGVLPAPDAYLVRATVPRADGERITEEAIRGGFFRPADIAERTERAPLLLAWIPVWRVDAAVEGFHVGLSHGSTPDGRRSWTLPTGGYRHRDGVFYLPARRLLAVDPTEKLEIGLEEMIPRSLYEPEEGEMVAADVTRTDAETEAVERLRRRVQPQSALYAKFDARVRTSALAWVPLWVARYRYRGEAARTAAPEECHVAVSARTGQILSARHPSKMRAAFGKVKGFLGTLGG
jgi:hypothetical protein